MSLLGGRVVVVDTETTGFEPSQGHELVEVALVELEDGAIVSHWTSLVKPSRPIPIGASRIHGITDSMVADAPPSDQVAAELRPLCSDDPIGFHHASFDLPFLEALFRAAAQPPLRNPIIDTLGLARGLWPGVSHSLLPLALELGLPPEADHRALGDALHTARLLVALADRWEKERGVRSLAELAAGSLDVLRASRGSWAAAAN